MTCDVRRMTCDVMFLVSPPAALHEAAYFLVMMMTMMLMMMLMLMLMTMEACAITMITNTFPV